MSFFSWCLLGKNIFVCIEFHPKPMSSTQGIKSLKALVISIKVNDRPLSKQTHSHNTATVLGIMKARGHVREKVKSCAQSLKSAEETVSSESKYSH